MSFFAIIIGINGLFGQRDRRCAAIQNCKLFMYLLLFTSICLFFSACAGTVEKIPACDQPEQNVDAAPDTGAESKELAVCARFQREDGVVFSAGCVRLFEGDASVDYALDQAGELRLTGLSRTEDLSMYLLDAVGRELCHTTIHFSTGALIDASTDQRGDGYVTVRKDTGQVNLRFTLLHTGSMQCALVLRAPPEKG